LQNESESPVQIRAVFAIALFCAIVFAKAVNIENTQKRAGNLKNTATPIEEVLKIRHLATRWAAID